MTWGSCSVKEDQTLQGGGQWEGKHLPLSSSLSVCIFLSLILLHLHPYPSFPLLHLFLPVKMSSISAETAVGRRALILFNEDHGCY